MYLQNENSFRDSREDSRFKISKISSVKGSYFGNMTKGTDDSKDSFSTDVLGPIKNIKTRAASIFKRMGSNLRSNSNENLDFKEDTTIKSYAHEDSYEDTKGI